MYIKVLPEDNFKKKKKKRVLKKKESHVLIVSVSRWRILCWWRIKESPDFSTWSEPVDIWFWCTIRDIPWIPTMMKEKNIKKTDDLHSEELCVDEKLMIFSVVHHDLSSLVSVFDMPSEHHRQYHRSWIRNHQKKIILKYLLKRFREISTSIEEKSTNLKDKILQHDDDQSLLTYDLDTPLVQHPQYHWLWIRNWRNDNAQ